MWPHGLSLLGVPLSAWNAAFLVGVLIGYGVLHNALAGCAPSRLFVRWLVSVYVGIVGAKLFAYAFDLNTSALPPPSIGWAEYYLDPLSGPKTLYGAILALPLAVALVSGPRLGLGAGLDAWTPALFAMLALVRIGCFLEGCCYGVPSDWLGLTFPEGSPVYWQQVQAGLIAAGSAARPVIPIQLIEAACVAVLSVWSLRRLRQGRVNVFPDAVALYSAARFVLEFARWDPERNFLGPLSTSQWIAAAVLTVYGAWNLLPLRPNPSRLAAQSLR
jgi:phosphatidylglycerol:prolipoprotein diacylglycerol transferase